MSLSFQAIADTMAAYISKPQSIAGLVGLGLGDSRSLNSVAELHGQQIQDLKSLHPAFILILARLLESLESRSVVSVLELLASLFAGQGAAAGSEQPPAFVAGDVARSGSFFGLADRQSNEVYHCIQSTVIGISLWLVALP